MCKYFLPFRKVSFNFSLYFFCHAKTFCFNVVSFIFFVVVVGFANGVKLLKVSILESSAFTFSSKYVMDSDQIKVIFYLSTQN